MIYRIAGHHNTLLIIALLILLGTAGIMTAQIEFLITHFKLNFIPAEVTLEDDIAILIAAFGVFLEHRSYLLRIIHSQKIPTPVEEFDKYSHNMGVMFIFVAILIVALDLLFLSLNTWGATFALLKYFEIATLFAINLMAFSMLIIFGLQAIKARGSIDKSES